MIIRKPYAFFIKYFKVFHILFFLLSLILVANTISLFEFFHSYISKTPVILSTFEISSVLINYLWIILLLIGLVIVMLVLIYKKKDIKFYIIQILIYVLMFVLFVFSNNTLNNLTSFLVDIRLVKALHDILFVSCIVQAVSMSLLFARATGFDIKNFEFDKEYVKLAYDESDREEVEVDFEFDLNGIKSRINRFFRNLKCFYLENKLVSLMLSGGIFLVLIIIFIIYLNSRPYVTVRGNSVSRGSYTLQYNGFYLDDSNTQNNIIDENSLFVIVDLNIKSIYNTGFNTTNLMINIDDNVYTPSSSYNQYFTDFGVGYNSQKIEGEGRYYLVYKIPSDLNLKNAQIVYNSGNDFYIKNIDLVDLRIDNDHGVFSVLDVVNVNTGIFGELSFSIDEVSFKEKFLVPYIFKTGKVNYNSSYYVSPSISGNYDKSIIRLANSDCDLIKNYGSIYYKKDNELKKSNVNLNLITPPKKIYDYCYFETDYDVLNSDTVLLKLNIRGNIYNYYLK